MEEKMSLVSLPLEVVETILLYVGVEDLQTVCDVAGIEGSDSFWKQVCNREGYKQISDTEESWRRVFQRNINWFTKNFVKREYEFKRSKTDFLDSIRDICVKDVLHRNNLIVKNDKEEMSVWNIETVPTQVQNLPAQYLRLGGSKLLAYHEAGVTIYSIENNTYRELVTVTFNCSRCFISDYSLTDEFFAAFDKNSLCVKIVDLIRLEHFSFTLSAKKVRPLSLLVSGAILNILILEDTQYVLKRFDLMSKEWLVDLVLFRGATLIGVPKLEISSDLIVSWSEELERLRITPVRIWRPTGQFLKSLMFDFIVSFGAKPFGEPEQILWMIVEGEYVIFSTSMTRVVIWSSLEPDICKEICKDKNLYNGQTVVSSSLLILSYSHCFKVVNFKKAEYLYDVHFGNGELSDSFFIITTDFFANEYFYVVLQEIVRKGDEYVPTLGSTRVKVPDSKSLPNVFTKWQKENPLSNKMSTIAVFDFRGECTE